MFLSKLRIVRSRIANSQFVHSRISRVLVLAFGEISSGLMGFISLAILVRILSKSEYGVYVQAMLVYSTFLPLLSFGLSKTLFVLIPRNQSKSRSLLFENQMILIVIGLVFMVFLLTGGSKLIAHNFNDLRLESVLPYLAFYFLFSLPLTSVDSALLSHGKTVTLAIFDVFSRGSLFVLTMIFVLSWQDVKAVLLGLVLGGSINFLVGSVLMYRVNNQGTYSISLPSIRTHFTLGTPLLLATSFGILQSSLDKWIVAILDTPENFAAFSIGATQIPFIGYFTGSVAQVLLADTAKFFYENRQNEVAQLLWRATLSSAMILIPIMFYFGVNAKVIIPWLFSNEYVDSVTPFTLYLLLIPARLINYSSIEIASGKTFVVPLIFGLNAVFVALLTILLYPKFGYLSAIYANLAVTYLFSVPVHFWVMTYMLKLPLRISFPLVDFLKLIAVIGLSFPILKLSLWMPFDERVNVFLIAGLYFPLIVFLFFVLKVNEPVIKIFRNQILNRIRPINNNG